MIRSNRRKAQFLCGLVIVALVAVCSRATAEQRTVVMGPVEFQSNEELLSMLPTVDFDTGWAPGPSPLQVKFKLFLSPGYMNSRHSVYVVAKYDTSNVKAGGALPVNLSLSSVGPDSFLRSGAGLIAESKWRVKIGIITVTGDIPYLPNINCGFQAHVGGYEAPMPNTGFKAGAKATIGDGFEIPLYTAGGVGEVYLAIKPGLKMKLGFEDLKGRISMPGARGVTAGQTPVQQGQEVVLVSNATAGKTFNVQLPDNLNGISDLKITLSALDYVDNLRISPMIGLALGVELGLDTETAEEGDQDQQGEQADQGEPPDGDDNEMDELEVASQDQLMFELGVSPTSVSIETPPFFIDLSSATSFFGFRWNLPYPRRTVQGAIALPQMPDLAAPAVSFTRNGNQITLNAQIDNQGNAAAGAFKVRWYKNGQQLANWCDTVNSLAVGSSTQLTHTMTFAAGTAVFEVTADADAQRDELCEINNKNTVTVDSPLDLSVSFPAGYLYKDAQLTQQTASGELLPGAGLFVKGKVSRRTTDVAPSAVPVEVWVTRCTISGGTVFYQGNPLRIGRLTVNLSESASQDFVVPWVPPTGVDTWYELAVRVDPEAQLTQTETTPNDAVAVNLPVMRPNPKVWEVVLETLNNPVHMLGTPSKFSIRLNNSSGTRAHNVPVRVFLAGVKVHERVISTMEPYSYAWIGLETPYLRHHFRTPWGGYAGGITVTVVIDPEDKILDMEDSYPSSGITQWGGIYSGHTLMCTLHPPVGNLRADLLRDGCNTWNSLGTFHAQESAGLKVGSHNFNSTQKFPAQGYKTIGKVGVSLKAVHTDGEQTEAVEILDGQVSVPAGGYGSAAGDWRPSKPGEWLLVANVVPPITNSVNQNSIPAQNLDDYRNDITFSDNTVAKAVWVSQPRPDLQAQVLYTASMPRRSDLANLRRLSGRVADAFSGSARAQTILKKETDRLVAGAPGTFALRVGNPTAAEQYPVTVAHQVLVNLYATFVPEWTKREKLANMVNRWRLTRDRALPALGRPVRNEVALRTGLDQFGVSLMPTFYQPPQHLAKPSARGEGIVDIMRQFSQARVEAFLIESQVLPVVENGALITFQWRPPHAGTWLLTAEIDPANQIDERDEANNSCSLSVEVRPSLHYFGNTPPLALASVRTGRGFPYTDLGERVLESIAENEPNAPRPETPFRLDGGVTKIHKELKSEVESATNGMPALMKRRAITIRQGQTFTLIGARSIDREHNIRTYSWLGPNVCLTGPTPNLVIDTSRPGMDLPTGIHRYELTVRDEGGLMHSDRAFVAVVRGAGNAADLRPVWAGLIPADAAPGSTVGFHVVIRNDGCGNTTTAFKVKVRVGTQQVAEQTVSSGLAGGDSVEVVFSDCWQAAEGRHALSVVADADREVAESDERNNTLAQQVNVDGNAAPRAVLSTDAYTVKAGEAVFLDATSSFDPDGQITAYEWFIDNRVQAGQHGRRLRYAAPTRAGMHKVKLVAVDNHAKHSPPTEATIEVVSDWGRAPVVQLPRRLIVKRGSRLTIPARGCYDPDGSIASFSWKLKEKRTVTGNAESFVLETRDLKPGAYTAQLTVTDNSGKTAQGELSVYVVEEPNRAPMIICPRRVKAVKGERVKIDASRSYDPDGKVADFLWIIPKTAEVGTQSVFEVDTSKLGIGPHIVVLAVSDQEGATTSRPLVLQITAPKGQPNRTETGWEDQPPMSKKELEAVDKNEPKPEGEEATQQSGPKPPPGVKPLKPAPAKPKLPKKAGKK